MNQSRGGIFVIKLFRSAIGALLGSACLAMVVSGPAYAQTISSSLKNTAYGFASSQSQARFAEVLTAPNTRLKTFTVGVDYNGNNGTFVAQVFAWNGTRSGGSLTGAPLYTSAPTSVVNGTSDYAFTPPAGGVALTAGQAYALVLTATGNPGNFPAGGPDTDASTYLMFAESASGTTLGDVGNVDAVFSATFDAAPAPVATPVPTLSEWAMILLGAIIAGGAALYIQRRQLA